MLAGPFFSLGRLFYFKKPTLNILSDHLSCLYSLSEHLKSIFFSCVLYPTHDKRDLKYWHFPWGRISIMGMLDLLRRQTINFLQESSCGKLWLKRQRGRINLILVSQLESFLKDRHLGASLHPICQDTLQPTHLPA